MPSLRKRVSSYFRQLSFHNEPRRNINDNSFINKYLQGYVTLHEGPPIVYGKTPTDLPNYELGEYEIGSSLKGCYTGPHGGLTTVKRMEKHLDVPDPDIDFIDTPAEDQPVVPPPKSPQKPFDNTTMVIKVAGQEYRVTNRTKRHSKSHSLGSLSEFGIQIETTRMVNEHERIAPKAPEPITNTPEHKYDLAKSKSEGNPFRHKKRGRIIKIAQRPSGPSEPAVPEPDKLLPSQWNHQSETSFGISDSLYDRNQVTETRNGDPVADCFGLITREDSAIIAVADGVNWGEKASVAAKSAIHGCLHYLNKTLFNDASPFDQSEQGGVVRVRHTREVFVCLLRAFSCAHDLILENKGMLTTLTVAVVLPLRQKEETPQRYVCCVCNVGDTLAYVYSQRYGVRELTKGSHDVNCNRDMRDALGALGPVDGINPELSNLTLSITTLSKGDIVMVASDGLTDNFDPNVCRFTVNSPLAEIVKRAEPKKGAEPPVKPPRRSVSANRRTPPPAVAPPPKPTTQTGGYKFLRSKTTIEMRASPNRYIARNVEGVPYVTPLQRYELQLLLIEDVLKNGISGRDSPCTSAKKLCENLVSFTFSITSAKRHTLEDPDLYFDNRNGVLVEVNQQEKKLRRKKGLEKVQNLPGKLDHVTVAAWNVANFTPI